MLYKHALKSILPLGPGWLIPSCCSHPLPLIKPIFFKQLFRQTYNVFTPSSLHAELLPNWSGIPCLPKQRNKGPWIPWIGITYLFLVYMCPDWVSSILCAWHKIQVPVPGMWQDLLNENSSKCPREGPQASRRSEQSFQHTHYFV